MTYYLLATIEIMFIINVPLIFLYVKGQWSIRTIILSLVIIPLLWYLSYAPIHELSHVCGTYLAGGSVTDYKLIPSFWIGEFGRAWITSEGFTHTWQQLLSTTFPYILDLLSIAGGIFFLQQHLSRNPFIIGFTFMLLCLRPAFDFASETTGFISGNKGDFYAIQDILGSAFLWLFMLLSMVFSFLSIVIILKRFVGLSVTKKMENHFPSKSVIS
jgi:hypothetical protein